MCEGKCSYEVEYSLSRTYTQIAIGKQNNEERVVPTHTALQQHILRNNKCNRCNIAHMYFKYLPICI